MVRKRKDPPQSVHHVQPKSKEGLIVSCGARPTTSRSIPCEDPSDGIDVDLYTTNHEVTDHESYQAGIDDTSLIPSKESELPFDLEAPMPQNTQFQLDLLNILSQHRTDLKVYDQIISVIKRHSNDQSLTFSSHNLKTISSLLKDLKRNMDTTKLKPEDVDVNLTFGAWLGMLATCWQHVAPTAKCQHFWPTSPCRGDTKLIPTQYFRVRDRQHSPLSS